MSGMKAYPYSGKNYPRGLVGKIVINRDDVVKYVTEWNEYVKKYKSGEMSFFEQPDNVQDFIFNQFIKDYDEGVLEDDESAGLTAYKCHSYLTDLTFKRRLNACMRGQKPFECHFMVKFDHMNDYFTYYTVDIVK
jgi:hypothetical protein